MVGSRVVGIKREGGGGSGGGRVKGVVEDKGWSGSGVVGSRVW